MPLPEPDAPEVTVSQVVLLLTAVQVQPVGAVTLTVPEVALDPTEVEDAPSV